MDDREFFNKIAPQWDENEILSTPERINYILDFINIRPGDKVLDLGTGTGVLLPYLAERVGENGEIVAVDFSSGMLEIAKNKYGDIVPAPTFLNLDFETDTITGKFDKILLYSVYPHLHTPFETLKWLKAVNLNAGGEIIIAFPTDEKFINNIHKEVHSESGKLKPAKELCSDLNRYGLEASVINANEISYIISIK